jgi:ATP-binding cassette subfamily F protein 3
LSQTREDLVAENRVIDEAARVKDLPLAAMRDFLAHYLFTGDDVFKKVADLSGGEKCRVALAQLTLKEPNFLVLDEPTNQLDIPSQEVLEGVLEEFLGTILFVSHDRYLIDALATQAWVLEGGHMRVYKGDYQEYLARRQAEEAARREEAEQARRAAQLRRHQKRPQARPSPEEGRTIQQVEEDIAELEGALERLGEELAQASVARNLDRVRALGVEYEQVQTELEELMAEWTALGEAGE